MTDGWYILNSTGDILEGPYSDSIEADLDAGQYEDSEVAYINYFDPRNHG